MKVPFTYCLLRYFHDVLTDEFVNIGIVVYAPKVRFLGFKATPRISRISSVFPDVRRESFRGFVRFIQSRLSDLGHKIETELPLDFKVDGLCAREIGKIVLPDDSSSLQWSEAGSGLTDNPRKTLELLFERMVCRYERHQRSDRKEDKDVWMPFHRALLRTGALVHFRDVELKYGNYSQHFEHGWQNGRWHIYQPLSFDLIEKRDIVDKAVHWSGRVNLLHRADPEFKIYWLVGAPQLGERREAFEEAKNLLAKEVHGDKEVIEESEAEAFSQKVAKKVFDRVSP